MDRIDRLFSKVQAMRNHVFLARIVQRGEEWEAVVLLWDGIDGHRQEEKTAILPTKEDAIRFIEDIAGNQEVPILVTNFYW